MRSKAPLVLMEQLIMVLVFAIAAALCLRVFAGSGNLSKQYEMTDRAVLEAQAVAESLKHSKTEPFDGQLTVSYDENWLPTSDAAAYYLHITCSRPNSYLVQANISVCTADGKELFALPVAWQTEPEVSGNE